MAEPDNKTESSLGNGRQNPRTESGLGPWSATAICGNDIAASSFYVVALTVAFAGAWASLVLLFVAFVLFIYRRIYEEVLGVLPLNGGTFNCLLNTTTKVKASMAASLTVLSYTATVVVGAKMASEYLHLIVPNLEVGAGTLTILCVLAAVVLLPLVYVARFAVVVFALYLGSIGLLILLGVGAIVTTPELLSSWLGQWTNIPDAKHLFIAVAVGLLGINGFESSANYIEQQRPGVFPLTLRNMWLVVTFLNPVLAMILAALGLFGSETITPSYMLHQAALSIGGAWLGTLIAATAFVVMMGAVLAGFIGMIGLAGRMTLDRCLPQYFRAKNRFGVEYRLVVLFLCMCIGAMVYTRGDLLELAGVYSISFLLVMLTFAVGNILLKLRRAKMVRARQASWPAILVAIIVTALGIIGNLVLDPHNIPSFFRFLIPLMLILLVSLYRHWGTRLVLSGLDRVLDRIPILAKRPLRVLRLAMKQWAEHPIVFFTRGDDLASLNKALLYVRQNETTHKIKVVHVGNDQDEVPARLASDVKFLRSIYPDLRIDLELRRGRFGPDYIQTLSTELGIAPNYMFVGTPGDRFPHRISDLGGVRVVI